MLGGDLRASSGSSEVILRVTWPKGWRQQFSLRASSFGDNFGRRPAADEPPHYGTKPGRLETANHSAVSEQASGKMSAAERMSEASRAEQANEWAVRGNEQTDERVAQYLRLDSWLFWTIVCRWNRDKWTPFNVERWWRRRLWSTRDTRADPYYTTCMMVRNLLHYSCEKMLHIIT